MLEREGFIRGFGHNVRAGVDELRIELKYNEGSPVISKISRVSSRAAAFIPKLKDLDRVYNGLGISILSTPRGVLSTMKPRQQNVGGEVLCQVF